jgi:DNA repair protein RecN (Recombination protein N)
VIERLQIEQLALVGRLALEFGPGLNVLTGETGAGKSIVLGALALLAGARAQPDAVREGAEQAVVEAVFRAEGRPDLEAALAERGLEAEDGAWIVRRTISRGGRSRAWVGGRLVPVSTLAELLGPRLEISSQHESHGLLRPEAQGLALDAFGELLEARARVEAGVRSLVAQAEELARLREAAEERARREDFLAFQVREIDEARLAPGEDAQLAAEHQRLVHGERLREGAGSAAAWLSGDPAVSDAPSATDLAAQAARAVEALAPLDPELAPLGERLRAAATELGELARELADYAAAVELDDARLANVEERLRQLERLRRKYGSSVEEILAFRGRAATERAALGGSEARMRELEEARAAEHACVASAARALGEARAAAATRLAGAVEAALRPLAMPAARFQVRLAPLPPAPGAPCAASGSEAAEFLFSANPGEPLLPLRRVVSGGELSRVFLALQNVLRRAAGRMVLVFDEVDAGIGGAVAGRVGAALAALARHHQILCITHLPQIAARADQHFQVSKQTRGTRTRSEVRALDEGGRIDELARMAGGETVGEATRRHARALLAQADAAREPAPPGPRQPAPRGRGRVPAAQRDSRGPAGT